MSVPSTTLLDRSPSYAEWRSNAEALLAHLNRCLHSHKKAIRKLDLAIEALEETMRNAAAGGTAWMRSNAEAQRPAVAGTLPPLVGHSVVAE